MLKYVGYSVLVTMDSYLAFSFLAYINKIMQNNVFRCDILMQITLVNALTIPFPYPLDPTMHSVPSLEYSKHKITSRTL